ncbi:hypothetical protein C0993_007363, partial [Termitomyces sp. T159_Od127]
GIDGRVTHRTNINAAAFDVKDSGIFDLDTKQVVVKHNGLTVQDPKDERIYWRLMRCQAMIQLRNSREVEERRERLRQAGLAVDVVFGEQHSRVGWERGRGSWRSGRGLPAAYASLPQPAQEVLKDVLMAVEDDRPLAQPVVTALATTMVHHPMAQDIAPQGTFTTGLVQDLAIQPFASTPVTLAAHNAILGELEDFFDLDADAPGKFEDAVALSKMEELQQLRKGHGKKKQH